MKILSNKKWNELVQENNNLQSFGISVHLIKKQIESILKNNENAEDFILYFSPIFYNKWREFIMDYFRYDIKNIDNLEYKIDNNITYDGI